MSTIAPRMETESAGAGERYERRRLTIIAAATGLLNVHGAVGMRLADVAAKLGLTTTSVTYYYKRKEDLVVACFEAGLAFYEGVTREASLAPTPTDRVRRFFELHVAAVTRVRAGQQAPIPIFSDLLSLKEPQHTRMMDAFLRMQDNVAGLLVAPETAWICPVARRARAALMLEQVFWMAGWQLRYSIDDFPRVRDRMVDILLNGLAGPGRTWVPRTLRDGAASASVDQSGQEMFLGVATRLINERGYRGASVNQIAAELNLTKGSFYHHHEAKDDLVVSCFKRSFAVMRAVQRRARDLDADHWVRLSSAAAALAEHQLSPAGPLLRTSALSALPPEIRVEMVRRLRRVSDHFAGVISDGIAEGCIRAVDPFIASQMLAASLNVASDLPGLSPGVDPSNVADLYARPLLMGLLTP
ncbi:TetR/AcrR family transcriptional regulator [soil metagenome]